jgi:hypothetical protein
MSYNAPHTLTRRSEEDSGYPQGAGEESRTKFRQKVRGIDSLAMLLPGTDQDVSYKGTIPLKNGIQKNNPVEISTTIIENSDVVLGPYAGITLSPAFLTTSCRREIRNG